MSNDPDNKNLPQVRSNANIALASKQLATVNKALTTISREKFIKFLAQNKDAAKFFISHISLYSNVLDIKAKMMTALVAPWRACAQALKILTNSEFSICAGMLHKKPITVDVGFTVNIKLRRFKCDFK